MNFLNRPFWVVTISTTVSEISSILIKWIICLCNLFMVIIQKLCFWVFEVVEWYMDVYSILKKNITYF